MDTFQQFSLINKKYHRSVEQYNTNIQLNSPLSFQLSQITNIQHQAQLLTQQLAIFKGIHTLISSQKVIEKLHPIVFHDINSIDISSEFLYPSNTIWIYAGKLSSITLFIANGIELLPFQLMYNLQRIYFYFGMNANVDLFRRLTYKISQLNHLKYLQFKCDVVDWNSIINIAMSSFNNVKMVFVLNWFNQSIQYLHLLNNTPNCIQIACCMNNLTSYELFAAVNKQVVLFPQRKLFSIPFWFVQTLEFKELIQHYLPHNLELVENLQNNKNIKERIDLSNTPIYNLIIREVITTKPILIILPTTVKNLEITKPNQFIIKTEESKK
ncbi:hypothetical protein QTN25_000390 [Entamoeba marina]